MDWVGGLGRIGGLVAAAAAVACGTTRMPAPSLDPLPTDWAAVCAPATVPNGVLTVALAGSPDPIGASDAASAVPRLLSRIAGSAAAPGCVSPRPAEPGGRLAGAQDTVVVRRVSDGGARDVLDQGADIVVTRDQPVVAYATGRPGLVLVSLPWDRVYVLVVRHQLALPDSDANPLRAALASDAVRVDARAFGAETVLPDAICGGDGGHTAHAAVAPLVADGQVPGAAHILYDQEDSVARFLAERIAVLASTRSSLLAGVAPALGRAGAEMYATGLPAGELPRAAMDAGGAAYIAAIPLQTPPSCGDAGALPSNAPGFTIPTGDRQTATVPLIETRAWAIVRRDAVSRIAAPGKRAVVAENRTP